MVVKSQTLSVTLKQPLLYYKEKNSLLGIANLTKNSNTDVGIESSLLSLINMDVAEVTYTCTVKPTCELYIHLYGGISFQ